MRKFIFCYKPMEVIEFASIHQTLSAAFIIYQYNYLQNLSSSSIYQIYPLFDIVLITIIHTAFLEWAWKLKQSKGLFMKMFAFPFFLDLCFLGRNICTILGRSRLIKSGIPYTYWLIFFKAMLKFSYPPPSLYIHV